MTTVCTCPKRTNDAGNVERCGLDVACPMHGDPAPHAAARLSYTIDPQRPFASPERRLLGCDGCDERDATIERLVRERDHWKALHDNLACS